MINYNDISQGIALALHGSYPDSHIHHGSVEQGLEKGDFNLVPITANHKKLLGARSSRNVIYDLIYFPESGYTDCLTVADTIHQLLETITTPLGNVLHCINFDYAIDEDVLHITLEYPHHVYEPIENESMNTIEEEINGFE